MNKEEMHSNKQFVNYSVKLERIRNRIGYSFILLVLLGMLFIYNVSCIYAWRNYADAMYFFKRRVFFLGLGFLSFLIFSRIKLNVLRSYSKFLVLLGILLLSLLLLFGSKAGGAIRWFKFAGISIQPSEFVKVFFILYVSDYLSSKKYKFYTCSGIKKF